MDAASNRITGAYELRLIDIDIAHLRFAVDAVVREANPALPVAYWRRRLESLMEEHHLLHHQFAEVANLLARLESVPVVDVVYSEPVRARA